MNADNINFMVRSFLKSLHLLVFVLFLSVSANNIIEAKNMTGISGIEFFPRRGEFLVIHDLKNTGKPQLTPYAH